jgi:hypothetical protein
MQIGLSQDAPNYVYELWYQVYSNQSRGFNQYFQKLKEADLQTKSGRQRFVDIQPYSNTRVISMPSKELGEFDNRMSSSAVFTKAFGADEYHKYATLYNEAQITATSVIRRYRNDLSLNRDKHARERTATTAYTFVTVFPLKGPVFEGLWLKAMEAYRKVQPEIILIAAQTIVGSGAQYVVARPLKSYREFEGDLTPEQAVEKAFGKTERDNFNRLVSESIKTWDTVLMDKGDMDTNVR